jgi:hypothetical protein
MKTLLAIVAILGGLAIIWPLRDKIAGWLSKPDELISKVDALISPPKSASEKPPSQPAGRKEESSKEGHD